MYQVSLSTMWAQDRFEHMAEFVAKAEEFGFTQVEAHSSLSPQMLDELIETSVPISSVHSPCPASLLSKGVIVASLSLSSIEEEERGKAVNFAKKTIDLASTVGAKAVVIHMGEVAVDADLEEKLHKLYQERLVENKNYIQVKEQLISERNSKSTSHLGAAKCSLYELARYGRAQGIMLGLENRYYFYEIPGIDEMEELLNSVEADSVGYWHDVGHAELLQQLGFTPHEEWLLRFSNRMIGIHLHDCLGISDHRVPGEGNVNWDMIAKYLPQGVIKTCEINQWNEEKYVRRAIPFLRRKGIIMPFQRR